MKTQFRWRDVPRAIWYFLEGDRTKFVAVSLMLVPVFLYDLVPAIFVGKIVDFFTAYQAGDSLRPFYILVVTLGVTYTLAAMARINCKKVISKIAHHMRMRSRVLGFERLTEFSLTWHAKENSGSKIQRIYTGGQALRDFMKVYQNRVIQAFTYTIGFITIISFFSLPLVIMIVAFMATITTIEWIFNRKIGRLADQYNTLDQSAGSVFVEGAGNMLAIKSLGSEIQLQDRVKSAEENTRNRAIVKSMMGFRKWTYFRIIDGPSFIIFLLIVGHGVVQGHISIGAILVLFSYWNRLKEMLWDVSDMNESLIDYKSDIGNMMPIFWEETHAPTGKAAFPKDWRKITIQGGHFAYPSGQVGMQDFDFELRRGEKLGIAGTSGSGKSSLVKILLGLYKIQKGSFGVDQTNFYDISHEDLMRHVSVVLQETELFNMSLQDNITMMRDLDPVLLERAIEVSQLREVIDKLAQGVDSLIGEKGYMLSGGERQRLGIARAIYKNAPIMILDEATSALDVETERQIMEKLLRDDAGNHTFMAIAHRQSTLDYTDRVITIEHGTVI